MLFDPRVIFVSLWCIECLGQIFFGVVFGSFATETWAVVAIAVIAFLSGAQLMQYGFAGHRSQEWIDQRWPVVKLPEVIPERFKLLMVLIYSVVALFVIQRIIEVTGIADVARPLECLRLKIVKDHIAEREIAALMKCLIFGVALSLYFLSDAVHSSKITVILLCVVGLLSALATTGRLLLLMFVLTLIYLMYAQKIWGYKEIFASLVGFFFLFFLIAFVTNKAPAEEWMQEKVWSCEVGHTKNIEQATAKAQSNPTNAIESSAAASSSSFSATDRLVWNAKTYFLASFAAFDHFVKTGQPRIEGGAFLPNAMRLVLNRLGADLAMRPAVNPVAEIAMPTNTYTAVFPLYHDMGRVGVLAWFFFLGGLHQFLYRMSQKPGHRLFRYFYAISLYPLCMVIFEEAYASSPGFWTVFVLTPFAIQLIRLVLAKLVISGKNTL